MARTRRKTDNSPLIQDIAGVTAFALGAVLLLGLLVPHSGRFGEALGLALKLVAGLGAYVVPILLMIVGAIWLTGNGTQRSATGKRTVGFLIIFIVFVSWCQFARTANIADLVYHRLSPDASAFYWEVQYGGGLVGVLFSYILETIFGRMSSYIILSALAVIALVLITGIPLMTMIGTVRELFSPKSPAEKKAKIRGLNEQRALALAKDDDEKTAKSRPEVLSIIKKKLLSESDKNEEEIPKGSVIVRNGNGDKPKPVANGRPAPRGDAEFKLPPMTILQDPAPPPKRAEAELNYKIDIIERTLEEFKIDADVVEVSHGPTVTRYEIQLAPGIKVSKIVSLADNLAMALAAIDVRVEAPIPGKSAIGVEVPNSNPAIVTLKQVIDTNEYWSAPSKLTFALGEDVAGRPRYADLTKMPHMLVAGATNAGKSICLNSLIASLLFRVTPREVKFILIDPKRVELSLFDGIPHLCTPVVKDTRQATGILRSALKEMEHRYDLFVRMGTRNFDGYNDKVKPEERLPYIVIIVDELADLMMQAGPEVEFSICRLAQLARATGIHLIIATQRPSVDVITGTIKANISSRMAFAMNSQIDSRTILDMGGAERLIGRGDMLFKPIDAAKPTRIQGCFVSEKEIEELVKHLKEQETPDYTMEPVQIGDPSGNGGMDEALNDEVYEPAVRLVVTSGYASTSMIQRRFKIGYTRAARLVDTMESQGIVGPLDGAKPRDVLISKEDLEGLFGGPVYSEAATTESFDEEEIE